MVTRTGGRLPDPRAATTSSGTRIPVAVLPPSSIVARNFMFGEHLQGWRTISPRSGSGAGGPSPKAGKKPDHRLLPRIVAGEVVVPADVPDDVIGEQPAESGHVPLRECFVPGAGRYEVRVICHA